MEWIIVDRLSTFAVCILSIRITAYTAVQHDSRTLWVRVAVPFLLFVIAGSLVLILFIQSSYQRRSHKQFVALAAANADFIRSIHIPLTDRLADYLSHVLGVSVCFRSAPPIDDRHESVAVPIEPGLDLILVREKPSVTALLLRPASLGVLGAFWGLSLALAWAITRAVVLPYLETRRRLVEAERLALLGKMATALAHEIQNPIAAIRLHAQLLEKTEPDPAALIIGEAATIESLVNQWMFLARPEPPLKSPAALDRLLTDAVRALTPLAEHARVRITLDAAASQRVEADARRLGQAIRNVILNAIQAMPAGGTLTISVSRRPPSDVRVVFADTGPGFTPTALARHAELFYSEKEGGMGIGLSVASEILKAHGGSLGVANVPAGGAVVTFQLPTIEKPS